MNPEIGIPVAFGALVLAALVFWSRGIVKARKDDLIAGLVVLFVSCWICMIADGSSASFGIIGGITMLFGFVTLVSSSFAKPDCPLTQQQRISFGIGAITLGLLMGCII
jgi:hypothetical protein